MTSLSLVYALQRHRFKPFELCLDSGQTIPVTDPDCVLFSEDKTVAVVAEGEHLHIVDLDEISDLSLMQD